MGGEVIADALVSGTLGIDAGDDDGFITGAGAGASVGAGVGVGAGTGVGAGAGVGAGTGVGAWAQPIIPNIRTDAITSISPFTIAQFIHLNSNLVKHMP